MRPYWGLIIVLVPLLGLSLARPARAASAVAISAPAGGSAVQGQVSIQGTSAEAGFVSAEVAFAYSQLAAQTWFPIANSATPVTAGLLATWDTTTLTDGTYDLRLAVTLADGSQAVAVVKGIRVRNYTPVETPTPTLTPTKAPLVTTPTPTPTLAPTVPLPEPTPLPANPAAVSRAEVNDSLLRGVGAALALFATGGLYLYLRSRFNRP